MLASVVSIVVPILATTLASALGLLLVEGAHAGVRWLKTKTRNDAADALLSRLDGFTERAVLAAEQTVVDSLRKSGEWGKPEGYTAAMSAALDALKLLAVAELPQLAAAGVGDVDAYLRQMLEAKLKELKWIGDQPSWPKIAEAIVNAGGLPPFLTSGKTPEVRQ